VVEVGPREHLALLALRVKRRSPSIRPIQRADAVTGWIQAQAEARTLLGAMGVDVLDPELALAPAPEQFLGGGVGILGREYGPTLDHVVGVQIVRVVGARPLSARTSGCAGPHDRADRLEWRGRHQDVDPLR
jgi:hypothetical protein